LVRQGIPATVLVDSAAAALMSEGKVDLVITGGDRIAANGDTANKIGTLGLASLASRYNIPFYVAAPLSTVDRECPSGAGIPIEYRSGSEVERKAPGVGVYNPAFDVTPAELITGIVTEAGILMPPFEESIRRVVGE
jgi:methylthioribose-1-phosphate isomerase